jgi:putative endonuclease
MRWPEIKCMYIMASRSRVLYTGSTRDLFHRVFEHKNGTFEGFTKKYRCTRLVYFERFVTMGGAYDREMEVKRWRREKKIALITAMNPTWEDLAADWYQSEKQVPRRAGKSALLGMTPSQK